MAVVWERGVWRAQAPRGKKPSWSRPEIKALLAAPSHLPQVPRSSRSSGFGPPAPTAARASAALRAGRGLFAVRAQHPAHQHPSAFAATNHPRGRAAPARGRPRRRCSLTQKRLPGEQGRGVEPCSSPTERQSSPQPLPRGGAGCSDTPRAPSSTTPEVPEAGGVAACPKRPGRQLAARGLAEQTRNRVTRQKKKSL